jgi:hypothetical protein
MKILITTLSIFFLSCNAEKYESKVLMVQDFSIKHPEWKVTGDTINKDINIEFQNFKMPANIRWLVAEDTSGCLKISYIRLTKYETTEEFKISNVKTSSIECGMKFESDDERKFETMLITGDIVANKGVKEYNFKGTIGHINGIGDYQAY